jgi:hypothetical protein
MLAFYSSYRYIVIDTNKHDNVWRVASSTPSESICRLKDTSTRKELLGNIGRVDSLNVCGGIHGKYLDV